MIAKRNRTIRDRFHYSPVPSILSSTPPQVVTLSVIRPERRKAGSPAVLRSASRRD